VHVTERRTRW